jgi:flavodoxin short chain
MASALIVYGSTTGNTEAAADIAEKVLSGEGLNVKKINVTSARPDGLCSGYDLILFGCSTWGSDSIELQEDFVPLFEKLEAVQAKGKNMAVFGCGDSSFTFFCGAVDAITEKLKDLGANIVDTLKIDGDAQSEKDSIEEWTRKVAAAVK